MSSEELIQALASMEILKEFGHDQLSALAEISGRVTFSEGAQIFREGDESELVYLVEEGEVILETKVPGHGQVHLLTIEPGQFLGWSSIFPPRRKTASARAGTPVLAIAIHEDELRRLCQSDTDLGFLIMWNVAQVISDRLRAARMQLLDVFAPKKSN